MCVPCHVFTMNNNVIPSILSYYSLSIYNINLQFDSKNMIKCFSCVSQANPYFQLTSTLMGQNLQLVAKVRPVPLFTSSGTEPALGFFCGGLLKYCAFSLNVVLELGFWFQERTLARWWYGTWHQYSERRMRRMRIFPKCFARWTIT